MALAWLLAEELGIPERSWAVWTPRVVESPCFLFLVFLVGNIMKKRSVKMDGNDS